MDGLNKAVQPKVSANLKPIPYAEDLDELPLAHVETAGRVVRNLSSVSDTVHIVRERQPTNDRVTRGPKLCVKCIDHVRFAINVLQKMTLPSLKKEESESSYHIICDLFLL
jgi:hypothetical protein